MTKLKEDLLAQSYCRQLGELMAVAKINKLTSMHISDWCIELNKGIQVNVKEKKDDSAELIRVNVGFDDLELFIKELQDALIIYSSKQTKSIEEENALFNNELKTRKDLQSVFGGVSPSTVDRFFKYLKESNIPFFKEALHGRSDVYRVGEMKRLYGEYQISLKNKVDSDSV